MASMDNSALGFDSLSFGPGNLYYDTATGGENIYLGETDSMKISLKTNKIDLKTSQAGDRPADKAVSSQYVEITCGLAQATLERLEQVQQGLVVDRDANGIAQKIHFEDAVGQRDSSLFKQLTFFEVIDGKDATEQSQPLNIIDFFNAVPSTDSVELTYDATTQRYYGIMFTVYKSSNLHPVTGKALYFSSRSVTPLTGISCTPATVTLDVDGTQSISTSFTPTGATYQGVTYSSDDISVATVSNKGVITAIASGTATITVTADYDFNITDTVDVTVN